VALQSIRPRALNRTLKRGAKRRRKLERRARRMEKAVRWRLYVDPLANLIGSVTGVLRRR
jgi:hypothetical protein